MTIAEIVRDETTARLERDLEEVEQISALEGLVEELVNLSGSDQPKRDAIGMAIQELEFKRQDYFTAQAEGFRLLNSPCWTPDGKYLIARKHFTTGRSIGAGEMWIYHVDGDGRGTQVTKRRTSQKNSAAPCVSPRRTTRRPTTSRGCCPTTTRPPADRCASPGN